jgi:hypothetical protein
MPENAGNEVEGRPVAERAETNPPERVDVVPEGQVPQGLGPLVEIARDFIGAMRGETESKERIALRKIEASHEERLSQHRVLRWGVAGVLAIAAVGAGAAFFLREASVGEKLLSMAMTGVLGLLAGSALRGKGKGDSGDSDSE